LPSRPESGVVLVAVFGADAGPRRSSRELTQRSVRVDLAILPTLLRRGVFHGSGYIRVELDPAGLTDSEHSTWQRRLDRLYNACGCETGAAAFLLAFPLLLVVFIAKPFAIAVVSPTGVVLAVGVPIVMAIVGKVAGLVRAHLALRFAVRELVSTRAVRTP